MVAAVVVVVVESARRRRALAWLRAEEEVGEEVGEEEVGEAQVEEARVIRPSAVAPESTSRRSSALASDHSGTLPCLRRGSSSRLVASIRSPATSFWRVSAGSITSSM